MPLARPSLPDLIARVQGDLRGRLEISGPLLRRAMADMLGAVWGGTVHMLYGALDWLSNQLFGDTAEDASLLRKASLYGITPTPAAFATGTATATGTIGAVVLAETVLRFDAVTSYVVTADTTLVLDGITGGGKATLPIESALAGAAANIPATTTLTFESPVTGVDATASVDTDIANGLDQETIDSVRARYLLRLREPPEGGAAQDYIEWTLAAGVGATRAWVFRNELGLGTVVVRFVEDDDPVSIFPSGGDITVVQNALNAQRPITAAVTAEAPTNLVVPFTIHVVPNTTAVQSAVLAELADLFTRDATPGDGAGQGTVKLSRMLTAIGTADGVTDFTLTSPSADVVPALGQLPTVGTPTWT